jgi:hypothetical protein
MTSQDAAFMYLSLWFKLAEGTRMGFVGLHKTAQREVKSLETGQLNALNDELSKLKQIIEAECKLRNGT